MDGDKPSLSTKTDKSSGVPKKPEILPSPSTASASSLNLPTSSDKPTIFSTNIDKSSGVLKKPEILPSFPSTHVFQQKTTDSGANKKNDQISFPISTHPSPASSYFKLSPSLSKPSPSYPNPFSSSLSGSPPPSLKEPSFSSKQTLAPSNSAKDHIKNKSIWVEKGISVANLIPVIQSKKKNLDSNKTTDKKLSHIISPALPSQASSSSSCSKLISSSSSVTPRNLHSSISSCSSPSSGTASATTKEPSLSIKHTLALDSSNSTKDHIKSKYIWVERGTSLTDMFPVIQSKKRNPDSYQTDKKLSHIFQKEPSFSSLSSYLSGSPPPSPKESSFSSKQALAPSNSAKDHIKNKTIWVEKGIYVANLIPVIQSKKMKLDSNKTTDQKLSDIVSPPLPSQGFLSSSFLSSSCAKLISSSSSVTPRNLHSSISSCSSPSSGTAFATTKEPSLSISLDPSNSTKDHIKSKYIWVERRASLTNMFPVIQSKKINSDSYQNDEKLSHISQKVFSSRTVSSFSCSTSSLSKLTSSSSSMKPPNLYTSTSLCSSFSSMKTPSTPEVPSLSTKRKLARSNFTEDIANEYIEKDASLTYVIPEDMKDLIKNDKVPAVLMKPLSPTTYKDYFAALLYAEDFYHEKWDGFEMKNVTLELHPATIYRKKEKCRNLNKNDVKDEKVFVAFVIDSIREKRPFLLSKDFVFVWPSGSKMEPFQGVLYRVARCNLILADFEEDFHHQHYSSCEYSVKFAFNRVCLKRVHQAIAAASDALFRNFLFPDCMPKSCLTSPQLCISRALSKEQILAVRQILSLHSPPPYIVEGPISVKKMGKERTKEVELVLTETGEVVQEAVLQIFRTYPLSKILICAPSNNTGDELIRGLKEIPKSDIFRANAAFRKWDEVPSDILYSSVYEEGKESFSCPLLQELKRYKVISSTFISSFRLQNVGLQPGHFSHIFLVDSSSVIEPETLVPLANLANENTVVVMTGKLGDQSCWVRSNIARDYVLKVSYFERLRKSKLYRSLDSQLITNLEASDTESWPSVMKNY